MKSLKLSDIPITMLTLYLIDIWNRLYESFYCTEKEHWNNVLTEIQHDIDIYIFPSHSFTSWGSI